VSAATGSRSDARANERLARARDAMTADGFDAVLLATGTNLCFLSGYPTVEMTLARPFFLVVPRRGAPVLLVHEGRYAEASRYAWISDIRTYRQLSVAPIDELAGILDDLSIRRGRFGAELGFEQRLGFPVLEFERLRAELEPATFDDAAGLLWRLRMIKSPDDIDSIRRACRITGRAYEATFGAIGPGVLDTRAARRMETSMVDAGGRHPWVLVTSGRGNYALATGAPTDRALEHGDMVWFDAGCSVDGFWSDFSRAGVIGGPTRDQLDAQRQIVELTRRGVDMVRPGVAVAEIATRLNEATLALDLPVVSATSILAGRIGHGIGYDITEPPHLSESDPTLLEAGMVVSIEPGIATEFGLFHAEENVLVTKTGREVLSACPPDLRSISAKGLS
jgi:Xaa-Pro aminopeptidase